MSTQPPVNTIVTHSYSASPERIFAAWLDPEMIGRFMFGPALRDEEVLHISLDARVGGAFSFLVRRQGQEIDHVGTYLEIDRPHRLVFTWAAGNTQDVSCVIIAITAAANGCELTLTHELHPDWAEFASRAAASWSKMLDALAAVLD